MASDLALEPQQSRLLIAIDPVVTTNHFRRFVTHIYSKRAVDVDADGVGNPCDDCPASFNPDQRDLDGDGRGDVCDNCPTTPNESQHDIDQNGVGDECDFEDGLIIFAKIGKRNVNWQSDPAYTSYNLYRGSLAALLAGGPYTQADGSNPYAGHFCGLTTTTQTDTLTPAAGEALYWLVTGKGASGEEALGHGDTVDRANANPCP